MGGFIIQTFRLDGVPGFARSIFQKTSQNNGASQEVEMQKNRCPKCSKIEGDGTEIKTRIKCDGCMAEEVALEEAVTAAEKEKAAKVVAGRKPIRERVMLWRADVPDPVGWKTRDCIEKPFGRFLMSKKGDDKILISELVEKDNMTYAHFSMAKKKGHMCYKDLVWLKKHLIGPDWPAVMVLPPEQEHINLHTECLHLWVCLDQDPLPDFRRSIELMGKAIQTI